MKAKKLTFITRGLLAGTLISLSGCGTASDSKPVAVASVNTYRSLVGPNWKPVDLGVGRKMYFIDKQGNGYLKTSVGLWKNVSGSWKFIAGSESLGTINKVIFDRDNRLYVGSSLGVFRYQNNKWKRISSSEMSNVDYMTIDAKNRLVVRTQLPQPARPTSRGLGGPFIPPVYGIEVYDNGKWHQILSNVTGIHCVAFASDTHYFYGTSEGAYEVIDGKTSRLGDKAIPLNASVYSLLFNQGTLYIGTSDGLWTYEADMLAHMRPLYPNSKITNLFLHGGTLYFTVDKLDNTLETWTLRTGQMAQVNVDFPSIQSIAVSPAGTVAELKVSSGHQTIVTIRNGQETDLHFPGHASKIGYSPSGVLTALTNNGVWIYQDGWKEIQLVHHGTVDSFYWTKDGALYLRSRDIIPIYSNSPTPAYEVMEIWRYKSEKWTQIQLPKGMRLFDLLAVSPSGELAISYQDNARHTHIDVYQDHKWTEVESGKGLFDHAQIGEMKFSNTNELTVSLAIYDETRSGVYGYRNGHWETLLANSGPLVQKGNYWFYTTQAQGATFLYIFGDRVGGFSMYEYKDGKWTDLHFHLYMPSNTMTMLPNHKLTVIPQTSVAWQTSVQ